MAMAMSSKYHLAARCSIPTYEQIGKPSAIAKIHCQETQEPIIID
jgi:hypothetical protein